MKNRLILSLSSLSLLAMLSANTYAADSSVINITATVVASPCQVSTPNITIPLGDVEASVLEAPNSYNDWSTATDSSTIKLINCPVGTTEVDMVFTGTPDLNDGTDTFLNAETGVGAATNVSIQMRYASSVTISNNSLVPAHPSTTTHDVSLPLEARLHTKNGNVTPGSVSAVINVAFIYK